MKLDSASIKAHSEIDKAKLNAGNSLDNVTLTAKQVDVMAPGEYTDVMDRAATETWTNGAMSQPWMKYALYGAAAFFLWKFLKK